MITSLYCLALLSAMVSADPYPGGNNNYNQWYNPVADSGHRQQVGQPNGQYDFGHGSGGGGGGGQQWQQSSGYQGLRAEAYHTHVFDEPDRYGYDYTMPGGTVHYLMYKKKGNRGPGGYGGFGSFGGSGSSGGSINSGGSSNFGGAGNFGGSGSSGGSGSFAGSGGNYGVDSSGWNKRY